MMSATSRRNNYIPSTTTFIFGKNPRLESSNLASPNKHWNLVRDNVRGGNYGFKVPDLISHGEGDKSRKYSSNRGRERGEVEDKATKQQNKNRAREASEEQLVATEQPKHWALPVYDFTKNEGEEEDGSQLSSDIFRDATSGSNKVPNKDGIRKSNDRPRSISVYDPEDVRHRAESVESKPNQRNEEVPYNKRRSRSVNDRAGRNRFDDDLPDSSVAVDRGSRPREGNRQQNRAIPSEKRNEPKKPLNGTVRQGRNNNTDAATGLNNRTGKDNEFDENLNRKVSNSQINSLPSQEIDTRSDSTSSSSKSSIKKDQHDDATSLQSDLSSNELDSDDPEQPSEKGKTCFLKKCAPKFAAKILNAIEQAKNECQLCMDDVAAKYKSHQLAKGEPVFTSYSCENDNGENQSFRQSMKKKISSLAGGFYSRACTGMKMIADILFEEEEPEKDGTWEAIEGEFGTRCVPSVENTVIEDKTVYVCSSCFDEVFDKNVHVSTKFLDEAYGCCKAVFISRSFENRPPLCEERLARMGEKKRELLMKIIGKEFQMKGGLRCCSKVPEIKNKDAEKMQNMAFERQD